MNFDPHGTLAGYARASVRLRARMVKYHDTGLSREYLTSLLVGRTGDRPSQATVLGLHRMTRNPWSVGEPYVVAPAMTAIIAAAAEALDLTGEVVPRDVVPDDSGVLFLPEPIYHRNTRGEVCSIGAITWTLTSTGSGGPGRSFTARSSWAVCAWSDQNDPLDPTAARVQAQLAERPDLASKFGPYVLADFAFIPLGRPVEPRADKAVVDADDHDWEPAPDGRYCLDETTLRTSACISLAYAFWRIQAQPLATVAAAPTDRAAARRAHRTSIKHDTRVVMLRRTTPSAEPTDGESRWHYRVRFIVRGHWRRLIDRDGHPYRVWIHAHIKGPDGAPLLHGEKVSVLAR